QGEHVGGPPQPLGRDVALERDEPEHEPGAEEVQRAGPAGPERRRGGAGSSVSGTARAGASGARAMATIPHPTSTSPGESSQPSAATHARPSAVHATPPRKTTRRAPFGPRFARRSAARTPP